MNGEQLRLPRRSGCGRARSVGNTALRSVAESIEGSAVEAANRRRSTEAGATATGGLAGLGFVEAPDKFPATLGAGENQGLAVVAGGHNGLLSRPGQGDQRKN